MLDSSWMNQFLRLPIDFLARGTVDEPEEDSAMAQMVRQLDVLMDLTCFQFVLAGLSIACAQNAKRIDDTGAGQVGLKWARTADLLAMLSETDDLSNLHDHLTQFSDLDDMAVHLAHPDNETTP